MKKLCFVILALFISIVAFANTEDFDYVNDGQQISYNSYNNFWTIGGINDDDIILYKKFYDGPGCYSQYLDSENKIIFTLTTGLEFVKDGVLYAINNNEFKNHLRKSMEKLGSLIIRGLDIVPALKAKPEIKQLSLKATANIEEKRKLIIGIDNLKYLTILDTDVKSKDIPADTAELPE